MIMTFGIDSKDLDLAARVIGEALGVTFMPHDSDSRGGDYCRATTSSVAILVQWNLDVLDDEPFEADWPVDKLIMYFDHLPPEELEMYTGRIRRLDSSLVVVHLRSNS